MRDFSDKTCQEVYGMVGPQYLRCGKPAVVLLQHRGRAEGPYYMCLEHGTHNLNNRDAEAIEWKDERRPWPISTRSE